MPYLNFTNEEGEVVRREKATWAEFYAAHLRVGEPVRCWINRSKEEKAFTGTIDSFWYALDQLHVNVKHDNTVITVRPGKLQNNGDKIVRVK